MRHIVRAWSTWLILMALALASGRASGQQSAPRLALELQDYAALPITAFPPRSIRLNKRLIRKSLDLTLDECLELSAAYQAIVQHTADQKEAVAALVEKRPAQFRGE